MGMQGIGERLKELRKEKEMTLDELGAILNIPKSSLSRYENNESDPSIETVKRIAQYFNVSIDWLSGLTDIRGPIDHLVTSEYGDILTEMKNKNISAEHLLKFMEFYNNLKEEK
jgi:transcriptional regulator with XRE-family HTH domain